MLHDDEAIVSFRVRRGQDEVVAHSRTASRFVQEEVPEVVFMFPEVHHLVVHCLARDIANAANNNVADFAAAVDAYCVEAALEGHVEEVEDTLLWVKVAELRINDFI